jgi:hypothetical protein
MYVIEIAEHGNQDEARVYGAWRSRDAAQAIADRFNAAADRADGYDPIYASVRGITRPTLTELKQEWLGA